MTVEDHSRKQFEKNKRIKMLKTKIDLLERCLSQQVADFEKERELLKFQNEQIIREQHEELRNLQESIRLKNNELRNLKVLCQMILDQRSDIEQFFLESMEQVKEEKRRKKEAELNHQNSMMKPEFLPLIDPASKLASKNYEGQQSQPPKVSVELNDLDWEDRETVLRLLFSKMNAGESATNWRDPAVISRGSRSTNNGQANELNKSFDQYGAEEEEYEEMTESGQQ